MATEIHQYTVTVPANTPQSALYTAKLALNNRVIVSLDLEVPPGPEGNLGFFLGHSGFQLMPLEAGEFIVWDDTKDSWPVENYPTGLGWFVSAYNLDAAYTHEVVVRFHTVYPTIPTGPTTAPAITFISSPALAPELILS